MKQEATTPEHHSSRLLPGRRGLVLGVSSVRSLGYHCLKTFGAHEASVAMSYRPRSDTQGEQIGKELGVPSAPIDVLDEPSIESGVQQLGSALGGIDFVVHTLVHAPSGALSRPLLDLSREDFELAMEVGARSLLTTTRHALPWLERSSNPRIVALLSAGGEFAIPNYHLIGIVKAALASTLRYLAQELGERGILCNGVSFSIVDTNAAERAVGTETMARSRDYIQKRSMTKAPLQMSHVTQAAAFLASEHCQNMTGEILNVDGGFCRNYF